VLGHELRLGQLEAAIANGQMGHMLDYDDTHMGGVILHASSPIIPALFALAERGGINGRTLIAAYVAGFEAGVRVGQAAPAHHDGGWHLTGTLGTIAAGAACARLLALDPTRMMHAVGPCGNTGLRDAAEPWHVCQIIPCRKGCIEWTSRGAIGPGRL
jgi:2-methylcitrate dehydratase PrpD